MISEVQGIPGYVAETGSVKPSQPSSSKDKQETDAVVFSPRAVELMDRRKVSEEERKIFKDVLARAQAAEAYVDPTRFLKSLTESEMEVLRKAHSLGGTIKIDPLDFEGAFNLLMPPGEAKDLNNDGAYGVGSGKGWVFPPPNAPASVKAAWDEATSGLTEMQKAMEMGRFIFQNLALNNQKPGPEIGFYMPGDPEFRNIYLEPGFSYRSNVQEMLKELKQLNPRDLRGIEILTKFSNALERLTTT